MKAKNIWWVLLLKGIILILFGLFTVFWPAVTFIALALIFALYILLSGVINITYSILGIATHRYWFLILALGVFEISVGVFAIDHPRMSIAALALLIGFTFLIRGIFEVISAFDDLFVNSHRILQSIGGILSLIVGIIILRYPISGSITFTWVLGIYALITGPMLVALSIMNNDTGQETGRKAK